MGNANEQGGVMVPRSVAWSVAGFLAAWTLGGLFYTGRIVSQLETLTREMTEVKLVLNAHDARITVNREGVLRLEIERATRTRLK